MEIRAKSQFNKETMKSFSRMCCYKKHNPKKAHIKRVCIVAVIALLYSAFAYKFETSYIPTVLWLFVIAYEYFIYYGMPVMQFKKLAKMQDTECEFVFTDDEISIVAKGKEYYERSGVKYSIFVQAYETSKYIFLYLTKNQVYIVEKSTIENGSADELRNKLSNYLKTNYYICKY